MTDAKPTILIGQDNWPLLISKKTISGSWDGPVVSKTMLGWVLHGNIGKQLDKRHTHIGRQPDEQFQHYTCHVFLKDDLDLLHNLIKSQWSLEAIGVSKIEKALSRQDMRAQQIIDSILRRVKDQLEIGLLWKTDNIVLPQSRHYAYRRLMHIEKNMDKNMTYARPYCNKINEYINKGYLRKFNESEAKTVSPSY